VMPDQVETLGALRACRLMNCGDACGNMGG
jgi:hypothetical protein